VNGGQKNPPFCHIRTEDILIAMTCVSHTSAKRPTMSQVVTELKECLETELTHMKEGHESESTNPYDMINMNLTTELNPLPR
jgi:hypothetical protein